MRKYERSASPRSTTDPPRLRHVFPSPTLERATPLRRRSSPRSKARSFSQRPRRVGSLFATSADVSRRRYLTNDGSPSAATRANLEEMGSHGFAQRQNSPMALR